MEQERLIFHIDVNSAFLSWEAARRLRDNPKAPDLRALPSAVANSGPDGRGVILAKSIPAKAYGVATGEPVSQALRKCPSLTLVPSDFKVYRECSSRLIRLLESYTPDIEKFSIDEAFLDMTSTIHLFGPPLQTARRLREQIRGELGFTVNIGIAPNKLLAKMASDFRKPDLCHTLFYDEIPEKMWPLPVRELFFVGGASGKKLEDMGIHTIGELASCDVNLLKSRLGGKYAALIHDYANGVDHSPVKDPEPVNKGYGSSVTLSEDARDMDTACQVLLSLSETVGARLRADSARCSCICVEIKDWKFKTQSHQASLDFSTDSTSVIYECARRLLGEFWDFTPLRLIGIRTAKITGEEYGQLSFLESEQSKKMSRLEKTVDRIRDRFGTDSIMRASFLKEGTVVDHASGKSKYFKPLEP